MGFYHPLLGPETELCRWVEDACFITIDGSLLSCCESMIDVPRQPLATLEEAPLTELWQYQLLWNYRLPLTLGLLPPFCDGCEQAPVNGVPFSLELAK
jgi:hypothetical protein